MLVLVDIMLKCILCTYVFLLVVLIVVSVNFSAVVLLMIKLLISKALYHIDYKKPLFDLKKLCKTLMDIFLITWRPVWNEFYKICNLLHISFVKYIMKLSVCSFSWSSQALRVWLIKIIRYVKMILLRMAAIVLMCILIHSVFGK